MKVDLFPIFHFVLICCVVGAARGIRVSYPPWDTSGVNLVLSGAAGIQTDGLHLTSQAPNQQAVVVGRAMYATATSGSSDFTTSFIFSIPNTTGTYHGDGMAFVMSEKLNLGSTVGESAAAGAKYLGIFSQKTNRANASMTVAVEFDTVKNAANASDPDGNHIGIDINSISSVNSTASQQLSASYNISLAAGGAIRTWIDYGFQTRTLQVFVARGIFADKPSTPLLSYVIDLSRRNLFVGFAGARTLNWSSSHQLLWWDFVDSSTPEPHNPGPVNPSSPSHVPPNTTQPPVANKEEHKHHLQPWQIALIAIGAILGI